MPLATMVNCFRGVPYKLCCTNYLKATNVMHLDCKVGLRKTTPTPSEFQNGHNEKLLSECKLDLSAHCKKDDLFSSGLKSLSMHNMTLRPYRGNVINILPSSTTIRQSTYEMSNGLGNYPENPKSENLQGRPSEEQLERMVQNLTFHLPKIFVKPLPVDDYHRYIILENNFRNKRTVGLVKYVSQLAVVKIFLYFKFAYVRLKILKITKHPEDGTIKVRWRVVGIPGMKVIFQFWKFNPFKVAKHCEEAPTWIDGFSIYYIGEDGKIFKHVLDRMQPNEDRVEDKPKSTIAPKVTFFLGLLKDHKKAEPCASSVHEECPSYLSQ